MTTTTAAPDMTADESEFEWHECPFCKGTIGLGLTNEKRVAHTLPVCTGYAELIPVTKNIRFGMTSQPNGEEQPA